MASQQFLLHYTLLLACKFERGFNPELGSPFYKEVSITFHVNRRWLTSC
jgi:hypothetical protein